MRFFWSVWVWLWFAPVAFAAECQKLCDYQWWSEASVSEIKHQMAIEDVNGRKEGLPPLSIVASIDNLKAVTLLIEAHANVNFGLRDGTTALYWAARQGASADVIHALIGAGGSPVSYTFDGETPLTKAAVHSDIEAIKALVAKSAHITSYLDHLPSKGGTALMRAARYQDVDVIAFLLDAGADPLTQDQRGKTAADYAKSNRRLAGTSVLGRLSR